MKTHTSRQYLQSSSTIMFNHTCLPLQVMDHEITWYLLFYACMHFNLEVVEINEMKYRNIRGTICPAIYTRNFRIPCQVVPITDTCLLHGYSKADLTEYSAVLEKGTYLYILYLYFHAFHKNQVIYTPPFIWNSSFHLVLLWLIPMVNNIVVNIIVVRANSFF